MLGDFAVRWPGLSQAAFAGAADRLLLESVLTSESGNHEARDCDAEHEERNHHAHSLSPFQDDAGGDQHDANNS